MEVIPNTYRIDLEKIEYYDLKAKAKKRYEIESQIAKLQQKVIKLKLKLLSLK